MEQNLIKKIEALEQKIDAIYVSVEKTRKLFFWTMIVTLLLFILPLIGLALIAPAFIASYTSTINGLGL